MALTTSNYPGLFELVHSVHESRDQLLLPEDKRLVERQYLDLVRAELASARKKSMPTLLFSFLEK